MRKTIIAMLLALAAFPAVVATEHPCLLLTRSGVSTIKASLGTVPMFDASVAELLSNADAALGREVCVPVPKDGGGGYTHEKHKLNYFDMYNCGVAWQLTGNKEYALKVKEILMAYAELYPTLGYHGLGLSGTPGRLFWQTLNESVWLVHTSQAYDCIWDTLTKKERKYLETTLFRPYADFVMHVTEDNCANQRMFNTLNNHATWANTAVGMIAMVMGDRELLEKALYGTDLSGERGFIRQLDVLISPDGYFNEGAYYQRYAIWPFVMFAQCLDHNRPDLGIFSYRDGIILKAVDTLLQMAYDGVFMRFNDALEKGYTAQELISAVDIAYNANKADKQLLSVARDYQHKVVVTDAGYAVAKAIRDGEAEPLKLRSCVLRDGGDGTRGAVAVLRPAREDLDAAILFKATSHGLSHGHYDRLNFAYYDSGNEVVTDYGASRFLNIEAKYKGHYTRENKTYAQSTIAHNTLVADCRNQFGGKMAVAEESHPEITGSALGGSVQMVSAREDKAYPGIVMERFLFYAEVPFLQYPLIMDLLRATSGSPHTYDYPVHYNGHMISLSVPYTRAMDTMHALGTSDGYQHLWVEAEAAGGRGKTTYTWLTGRKMYSLSTATTPSTKVFLARTGAADPDFNLRSEPMYLIRESSAGNHLFASCLETHGKYDIDIEQSDNLESSCTAVEILENDPGCISVFFGFAGDKTLTLTVWPAGEKVLYEINYDN